MYSLVLAEIGEENVIKKIDGTADVKDHLAQLGFSVGKTVTVVSKMGSSVIVSVKDTRVAVSEELARKIML